MHLFPAHDFLFFCAGRRLLWMKWKALFLPFPLVHQLIQRMTSTWWNYMDTKKIYALLVSVIWLMKIEKSYFIHDVGRWTCVTIGKGTRDVVAPLIGTKDEEVPPMVIGIVWDAGVEAIAGIVWATVTTGGAIEIPAVAKDTYNKLWGMRWQFTIKEKFICCTSTKIYCLLKNFDECIIPEWQTLVQQL